MIFSIAEEGLFGWGESAPRVPAAAAVIASGGHGVRHKGSPVRDHFPKGWTLVPDCLQHVVNADVARLAPPAKLYLRPDRPEANRHGGEHTQQRRLHERAPMR